MGSVKASSASQSLKMSFSSIKLALLVGMFKKDGSEIVLGDVIISETTGGSTTVASNARIQYLTFTVDQTKKYLGFCSAGKFQPFSKHYGMDLWDI
ncbi:hypothetical protein DTO169E5_1983 [Paecilomyces variotii]|nr:hypothetical protein DTO169E5_1983 [Paecilomyces variotii]